jgi:hypothetical protein
MGARAEEPHSEEHEDIAAESHARDTNPTQPDDDDPKNELDDSESNKASGIEWNVLPANGSFR